MIFKSNDDLLINCFLFIYNKGIMGKFFLKYYDLILVFDLLLVFGNGGNCWFCFIGKWFLVYNNWFVWIFELEIVFR